MKKAQLILVVLGFLVLQACSSQVKDDYAVKRSMVVFPFENLSGVEDYNFMALGLADEMGRTFENTHLFSIIEPSVMIKQLEYTQLTGTGRSEEDIISMIKQFKPDYAVIGNYNVKNGKIEMSASVIQVSGNLNLGTERADEITQKWSDARALLSLKLVKRMNILLTAEQMDYLMRKETQDFEAFRLHCVGRMYSLLSQRAQYEAEKDRSEEVRRQIIRYHNLAMAFWARSAERDPAYRAPQDDYFKNMDPGDVRTTIEKSVEIAQGGLNGMVMYGFQYKSSQVWDVSAWVRENAAKIRSMVAALPAGYVIEVQGHTDGTGPEEPTGDKPGNIAISEQRAKAVYEGLLNIGIPAAKLRYRGYGSSRTIPWLSAEDPTNRRVAFEVKPAQ